jgi:hypothetical protein
MHVPAVSASRIPDALGDTAALGAEVTRRLRARGVGAQAALVPGVVGVVAAGLGREGIDDTCRARIASLLEGHADAEARAAVVADVVNAVVSLSRERLLRSSADLDDPVAVDELVEVGRRLDRAHTEVLATLATAARERAGEALETRDALLHGLIERPWDVMLPPHLKRMGFELVGPLAVVVLVDSDGAPDPGAGTRARSVADALPGKVLGPAPFEARPPRPWFAVVVVTETDETLVPALADACKRFEFVAVHATASSSAGVGPAFLSLQEVVPIAWQCSRRLGPAFPLEATSNYLAAAALPAVTQIWALKRCLGPLVRARPAASAADRIDTLETFYAMGHENAPTAAALSIGPNGLRTRIRAIEALTGLDVRKNRLTFEVAVAIYRLYEDEWPPPDDPWWDDDDPS